jgi:hypothetical protein
MGGCSGRVCVLTCGLFWRVLVRRSLVVAVVTAAVFVSCGKSETQTPVVSALSVSPDTVHFGHVPLDAKVVCSYTVANTGSMPVAIHRVTSHCPCIQAGVDDSVLAPLGTTTLRVVFDSKGFYPGMQLVKDATMHKSDPNEPQLSVYQSIIIGYEGAALTPEEGTLFLVESEGRAGVYSTTTTLTNTTSDTLAPAIETSVPEIGVILEPRAIPPGRTATLHLVTAEKPPPDFHASVTLVTSSGNTSLSVRFE